MAAAIAKFAKAEISRLEKEIRRHQKLYDKGTPEISDAEFDALVVTLKRLQPKSKALNEIGNTATRSKVAHQSPMLSLEKCYSNEDVMKWAKPLAQYGFVIAPKYDGLSLSVLYEGGKLVRAVTRGNGTVGDDVTHTARFVVGVPHEVRVQRPFELRGEVILPKTAFEDLKGHLESSRKGEGTVNARNTIAGKMLSKTPDTRVLARARFIAYDYFSGDTLPELSLNLAGLACEGDFLTGEWWCTRNLIELEDLIEEAHDYCHNPKLFDYEADGLVIKANRLSARDELGATSHHPRWALARKFATESSETILKDVVWQVSRTGTITPVAIVEPVELSGATVQRVTLHHYGIFRKLKPRKGCKVTMTRRGGVIPHIERIEVDIAQEVIKAPPLCPCCGAETARVGDFLRCSNRPSGCPDQARGQLLYWATTTEMMGWGEEVISTLFFDGALVWPEDFYRVEEVELQHLFGPNLGSKLHAEAHAKKRMPGSVLLQALGIEGIGRTQAEKVLQHFGTITKALGWARSVHPEPLLLEGFGEVLQDNLLNGLQDNAHLIEALLKRVEVVAPKGSDVTSGPFVGKKVVFTGRLADIERSDAMNLIRELGGIAPSGVTKDTAYLVVGSMAKDEETTKRDKAAAYNRKGAAIQVIDEGKFNELLAEAMEAKHGAAREE